MTSGRLEQRDAGVAAPEREAMASEAAGVASLLDALIDQAPALVRQRALLPAADWRRASVGQVARLLRGLVEAGMKVPGWLAQDLVTAGHILPAHSSEVMPAELRVLESLNALAKGDTLPDPLRARILSQDGGGTPSSDVLAATVQRLVDLGEPALACRLALRHWPQSHKSMRFVRAAYASQVEALPSLQLRVAGFSTTQPFAQALGPAFARVGCRVAARNAAFGTVIPELFNPTSPTEPMLVLLDQEAFAAPDWRNGLDPAGELMDERLALLAQAITSFADRRSSPLYINTLSSIPDPTVGHIDQMHRAGATAFAMRVNRRLAEIAMASPAVHLVDTDRALAAIPSHHRVDPKLWYYGRIAYSDEATRALARAFADAWTARQSAPIKVVALDFDNTLWGGVFGDDGLENLVCGDDFPGNAYRAFQSECLRLKAQGILLVAVSKNNDDAIDVFAHHPGMALAADDFTATAINWAPKPENIRQLAADLNLGLDSVLFLDDSPHEREAMRRMCPEVIVPEMPSDPALRPRWLRTLTCTWPVRLTAEDTKRSQIYAAERKARQLRETADSYEDYLTGLGQTLLVETLSARTLARIAQLHERTNQFNLTTRRFTESDLAAFMRHDAPSTVLLGTASDRFGDHGIVITAVATRDGATARIESLLMSCRVIARQIETAFLGALIGRLVEQGVETVEGLYLPTARNEMVRALYPSHGFTLREPADQAAHWLWTKSANECPHTPYVTVQWKEE